ncbi:MAG: phosphopyruvate hydratase, partial [Acetobacteraceae bacterium]|nr:phosphopyruvate hydratase [Acetobacteraceae bacterium]
MNATAIASVRGRRVWDSRGRPTVEAEITLACGVSGRAIAPAGASTGSGEAVDLRDGGSAFGGYDVTRAVAAIQDAIAPALRGMDTADQAALDARLIALDSTEAKSRLGANAILAVSMAAAHAAAAAADQPLYRYLGGETATLLPLPQIQIFGGGAHAGRRVDVQDFLVMCPAAASFAEALDWTAEVYRAAGALMRQMGMLHGVADEGGWWPAFSANEQAVEVLVRAIERAGFTPGRQVAIAL